MPPGVPESFKVLVKELQSLGLSVEVLNEEEKAVSADNIKEAGELEKGIPTLDSAASLMVEGTAEAHEGEEDNVGS
jgi:DNA-directed RNA polymerase subunit beta